MKGKRYLIIATIVVACAVIYGLSYYVVERPLTVTHEIYSGGLDPVNELDPVSTGRVVGHGVDTLPQTLEVGRVGSLTMSRHILYKTVWPGETIVFGFNSTRPVDFMVVLGDEPVWGDDHMNPRETEVLVNVTSSTAYFDYYRAWEKEVITFYFEADQETLSSVTLKGKRVSPLKIGGGGVHDPEVDEAIRVGQAFLILHDVDVGKVLEASTESVTPNYYWCKKLGMRFPLMPPPRECHMIRYEQARRPGHFYEVWVDVYSMQVVGGDECK